jgi:hypothetical protein
MDQSILRNTLLSGKSIGKILSMPAQESICASLWDVLSKFQDMKKFASEIHTETHLIKPILKMFGYAYESKPKFFEENIKGPDVALFSTESKKVAASSLWGTKPYYENALGILILKRYGRSLDKGISGFYLEFENKIPVYQAIYLLKKTGIPWGILTNGRSWILIKRPVDFEKRLIEIDIEASLSAGGAEALHLFYQVFSLTGLNSIVPDLLEAERNELIRLLKEKRTAVRNSLQGLRKKGEIYPKTLQACKEFFPEAVFPVTEEYLRWRQAGTHASTTDQGNQGKGLDEASTGKAGRRMGLWDELRSLPRERMASFFHGQAAQPAGLPEDRKTGKHDVLNTYNTSDIFSYLFAKTEGYSSLDLEEVLLRSGKKCTKEDILSLRILDMTPGFGAANIRTLEGLAYLSFLLPYKERNTFVAEWEDEHALKRYILNNLFYGVERSHVCLDMFQNTMRNRFNTTAVNYKAGNPLIGMSFRDIPDQSESKNQMALFSRYPGDIIDDFRETYRHYFSLSEKIKEDAEEKQKIEIGLSLYRERIRDTLDVMTATYFSRSVEKRKVQELLFNLGSGESAWEGLRKKSWFVESKEIAERNDFFHFEIEFPFLLNGAFDLIIVQPELNYIWEEDPPLMEATKAYVRKGMTYLRPEGKLVILSEKAEKTLLPDLQKSKKYDVELKSGAAVLSRKTAP